MTHAALRASGALTALVGLVHFAVGVHEYEWPSFEALWFHGTGMGLLLVGAMTVLAASGRAWRALVVVALLGNTLGLALALTFGSLSRWQAPQGPVLAALFLAAIAACGARIKAVGKPGTTPNPLR